jgi:3-deoxy-D-manno-octulosonic-acid transferase
MAWLLNLAYCGLLLLVSPWLVYRALWQGKYRQGWKAKFWGAVPRRTSQGPCLWLHAVSVGEVLQLQSMIDLLGRQQPDLEFVISVTTTTGYDVAVQRYPRCLVIYYPLDFSWAVGRALDRIRPTAIGLVELELWPNFLFAAAARQIPVMLVNGRISERSFRGYQRIRPFMRGMLRTIRRFLVQNECYGNRLEMLGAPANRISVTGSIKFDGAQTDRRNGRTAMLGEMFGLRHGEPVFIAGSTQEPEERYAIDAWRTRQADHPGLRLILVPRHKERFEEVARLVEEQYRLPLLRRSRIDGNAPETPTGGQNPIILLDTLGELSACWGLADFAFVGGSLTGRGGQNMIEPAGFGAAVLFGPNTWNFKDVVDLLLTHDAAIVVRTGAELASRLGELLNDRRRAAALGKRAQGLVFGQRGATERTVGLIAATLDESRQLGVRPSQRAA